MLVLSRLLPKTVLLSASAFVWSGGCAAAGGGDDTNAPPPIMDAGRDAYLIEASMRPDGAAPDVVTVLSPLCGEESRCMGGAPDDEDACIGFDAGSAMIAPRESEEVNEEEASEEDESGPVENPARPDAGSDAQGEALEVVVEAGATGGEAGVDARVSDSGDAHVEEGGGNSDAAKDAGVDGAVTDASVDGFSPDSGPDSDAAEASAPPTIVDASHPDVIRGQGDPVFACHVRKERDIVVHRCELAGRGGAGAPCTSSRDCAPGLGCVGDAEAGGECRPFCCRGAGGSDPCEQPESSSGGSRVYCAERPLRDDASSAPIMVPVCAKADNCRLDEPYPCTSATECVCDGTKNLACAVVRSDGTTSCVPPGTGLSGDPCPCAHGYFCAPAVGRCFKLCQPGFPNSSVCGAGRCQAAANLPQGFGLCVGAPSP